MNAPYIAVPASAALPEQSAGPTLKFLASVLPDNGVYMVGIMHEGEAGMVHKHFFDLPSMAREIVQLNSQPDVTVFHACVAFAAPFIQIGGGRRTRVAENVQSAKSLWIDVDVGNAKAASRTGYLTKMLAVQALEEFCETTGFPVPMAVDSGNGLHFYWPLTDSVKPDEWKAMARQLKASLAHFNVLADPTRTADIASVLRPVGSHNKKDRNNSKEVLLRSDAGPFSPAEIIAALSNMVIDHGVQVVPRYVRRGATADVNADLIAHAYPDRLIDEEAIDRATSALNAIPSDLPYTVWRNTVFAFNAATDGGADEKLHEWCAKSATKYPDHANALQKLLDSDRQPLGGIGAGSLFQLAKQHGWIDLRGLNAGRTSLAQPLMQTLNDAGNADRIVAAADGTIRYCKDLQVWYVWNDGHWRADSQGSIVRFSTTVMRGIYDEAKHEARSDDAKRLAQHASNSLSLSKITSAIELAKSCPGINVRAADLDAEPYVVGVLNGVVDLRTGLFRAARPDDLITRRMNVEYVEGAQCPIWEATLDSVFCGNRDVAEFVQRAAGYSMTGDTSEQCFFFLHGSGANGKSTVLNALREIMGDYAVQTSPDVLMAKTSVNASGPTPEIARLAGPRFVAANETEEGQRLAESMVKQLTGGDAVTARVLHGAPFDFVPKFKLWLAGNHRPTVRGDDHGIWRRMVMIGFDKRYSGGEQNKHLPVQLRNEYSGVLNWMIAGCLDWQKNGLDTPEAITRLMGAYRSDMDLVQHWIDEVCTTQQNARTRAQDLYTSYRNWAIQNGHRSFSNQKFAHKLVDRGFEKRSDKHGAYYLGLSLRPAIY